MTMSMMIPLSKSEIAALDTLTDDLMEFLYKVNPVPLYRCPLGCLTAELINVALRPSAWERAAKTGERVKDCLCAICQEGLMAVGAPEITYWTCMQDTAWEMPDSSCPAPLIDAAEWDTEEELLYGGLYFGMHETEEAARACYRQRVDSAPERERRKMLKALQKKKE